MRRAAAFPAAKTRHSRCSCHLLRAALPAACCLLHTDIFLLHFVKIFLMEQLTNGLRARCNLINFLLVFSFVGMARTFSTFRASQCGRLLYQSLTFQRTSGTRSILVFMCCPCVKVRVFLLYYGSSFAVKLVLSLLCFCFNFAIKLL